MNEGFIGLGFISRFSGHAVGAEEKAATPCSAGIGSYIIIFIEAMHFGLYIF